MKFHVSVLSGEDHFLLSNFGLLPKTTVTGTATANNRISRVQHKRHPYMQPGLRLRRASQ